MTRDDITNTTDERRRAWRKARQMWEQFAHHVYRLDLSSDGEPPSFTYLTTVLARHWREAELKVRRALAERFPEQADRIAKLPMAVENEDERQERISR